MARKVAARSVPSSMVDDSDFYVMDKAGAGVYVRTPGGVYKAKDFEEAMEVFAREASSRARRTLNLKGGREMLLFADLAVQYEDTNFLRQRENFLVTMDGSELVSMNDSSVRELTRKMDAAESEEWGDDDDDDDVLDIEDDDDFDDGDLDDDADDDDDDDDGDDDEDDDYPDMPDEDYERAFGPHAARERRARRRAR